MTTTKKKRRKNKIKSDARQKVITQIGDSVYLNTQRLEQAVESAMVDVREFAHPAVIDPLYGELYSEEAVGALVALAVAQTKWTEAERINLRTGKVLMDVFRETKEGGAK